MKLYMRSYFRVVCCIVVAVALLGITQPAEAARAAVLQEQIDQSKTVVAEVSLAVARSNSISSSERISMLRQLIELTRLIETLEHKLRVQRIAEARSALFTPLSELTGPESIGLHRVLLQIDEDRSGATAVEYYLDDSEKYAAFEADPYTVSESYRRVINPTFSLAPIDRNLSFDRQVVSIENQYITHVEDTKGITNRSATERITLRSIKHPEWESAYSETNSPAANAVLQNFGVNSVITQVIYAPGNMKGSVQMRSDQGETLRIDIMRRGAIGGLDRDQRLSNPNNYDIDYSFWYMTFADEQKAQRDNFYGHSPKVLMEEDNLTKDEVLDYISDAFSDISLTTSLPTAQSDFFSFLLENNAHYRARNSYATVNRQCIDPGDLIVLQEYTREALKNLGLQHIMSEDFVQVQVPVRVQDGIAFWQTGCRDVQAFF